MKKTGLRVGRVSSIDYKTGMMQVIYTDRDNEVTAKIPYANFNNEYCMPKIGERVLVGHLSNGSSRGVVLGTMWNKANIPEESGKGIYRKELSKVRGAAYTRFDDTAGEYLMKAPIILVHGVDRTDLEGPEVNIAANIRTGFESPEHMAKLGSVNISGLEGEDIAVSVENNMKVTMDLADLEMLIRKVMLETVEEMELKGGTEIKINAVENLKMEAGKDAETKTGGSYSMSAGENIRLEDRAFATTLSSVMERLEALDKNTSARKQG